MEKICYHIWHDEWSQMEKMCRQIWWGKSCGERSLRELPGFPPQNIRFDLKASNITFAHSIIWVFLERTVRFVLQLLKCVFLHFLFQIFPQTLDLSQIDLYFFQDWLKREDIWGQVYLLLTFTLSKKLIIQPFHYLSTRALGEDWFLNSYQNFLSADFSMTAQSDQRDDKNLKVVFLQNFCSLTRTKTHTFWLVKYDFLN